MDMKIYQKKKKIKYYLKDIINYQKKKKIKY